MKGKTALIIACAPIGVALIPFFYKEEAKQPVITIPVTVNIEPAKIENNKDKNIIVSNKKIKKKNTTEIKEQASKDKIIKLNKQGKNKKTEINQETHGDKSPILNNINGNININFN